MSAYNDKIYLQNRSVIFWLYDGKCYIKSCGNDCTNAHHNDSDNSNNELVNLIPLCDSCHRMVHRSDAKFAVSNRQLVLLLLRKITDLSL